MEENIPKIKWYRHLTQPFRVLFAPEEGMKEEASLRVSLLFLFLLIVLLTFIGGQLTLVFNNNPTFHDLTLETAMRQVERMQPNMSSEQREMVRQQTLATLENNTGSPLQYISSLIGSGLICLVILEFWLILIIFSKFLGGEEEPFELRKHRRSLYLCLYAMIPLSLSTLATGVMLALKDPASVANIITLEEYSEAIDLSLSLYSLFGGPMLPSFLDLMVKSLTNPLYLWMVGILVWGGSSVFRIPKEKAGILAGIVVLIYSLQSWGLVSLSQTFIG